VPPVCLRRGSFLALIHPSAQKNSPKSICRNLHSTGPNKLGFRGRSPIYRTGPIHYSPNGRERSSPKFDKKSVRMPPARMMHTGARLVCLLTCNLGTRIFTSSRVR
jgi:hypothetical protein